MGNLRDCCSIGSLGCCEMITNINTGGYESGLGAADADLAQKVQSTLNLMPGASSVVADQSKVGLLYDVFTNTTADQLDKALNEYKQRVTYLNESLRKIDARRDDLALRTKLLAEHAKTATSVGNYGKALIDQINKYNDMVRQFSGSVAGKITIPDTVPVTGLPRLDVPTLSGMSGLGAIQIPIALVVLVGIIALLLWKFGDLIQDYMHYDLKTKGMKEGMDREYEGFTGTIQKYLDKAGGSMLSTVLLVGAGVVAFLFVKNYMTRKGLAGAAPAKAEVNAAVKELETVAAASAPAAEKSAVSGPTAKEAVKEIASIAQGA